MPSISPGGTSRASSRSTAAASSSTALRRTSTMACSPACIARAAIRRSSTRMRTVSHPHSTRAGSRTASGAIGSNVRALVWLLAVVGALAVSWRAAGVDVGAVFTARTASETWRFVAALFPPDLSPGFLRTVALAVVQTVATAATATVLSLTAGLPLGTLASARLWRRGTLVEAGSAGAGRRAFAAMSLVARASLGFLRAVPDLLWAILFVTIVGLGPAAGTLALAVAYTGAIG